MLRNGDLLTWAINRKERGGRKENKGKNLAFLASFAVKNAQLICLSFLNKKTASLRDAAANHTIQA
ncbi:MAG TPA: hypothetical protein EYH05_18210 [Anaerolineae bacterium]|nr:hypothetical protein [Anaerolineae bacterium]